MIQVLHFFFGNNLTRIAKSNWKRTKEAYLRFSRSVQTWSHWAGSPETWSELKRAATTAGTLVRCLRSQSFFRIPATGGGGTEASFEGLAKIEILEKSGNARALIGGCSEWRWVVIEAWSSGHPTRDTNATGGVRSSSEYSSIALNAPIPMPGEFGVADNGEEVWKLISEQNWRDLGKRWVSCRTEFGDSAGFDSRWFQLGVGTKGSCLDSWLGPVHIKWTQPNEQMSSTNLLFFLKRVKIKGIS